MPVFGSITLLCLAIPKITGDDDTCNQDTSSLISRNYPTGVPTYVSPR